MACDFASRHLSRPCSTIDNSKKLNKFCAEQWFTDANGNGIDCRRTIFDAAFLRKNGKSILIECAQQLHDRVHIGSFFAVFHFIFRWMVTSCSCMTQTTCVLYSTSSSDVIVCLAVLENGVIQSGARIYACVLCPRATRMDSKYF